ncbi:MAG: 30S ribosomal protein S6 [Treponema sp.]|mgnify:CR=1|jgi:small subunit ribosomal protein S6|nr:30S ribosomal protein S6 [Treponema sp.]MCI6591287.1 30S ribosomal protein S6 [Spirochaetia bacterium]MDD7533180.1 30S ribosomal protein S6 [Treponema sp.]MDY3723268.1 30S ribosomal protein S6 [Treponema sp.]MDY5757424.1 30S ribosomal protein S6 [Treponema sp.]
MKKYELMTIYPLDDEKSKKGAEDVKGTLAKFGAEIEEEKPFGDRDLTYQIQKQKKGRFVLYTMKLNPSKITEIDKDFKINMNLLKYQFVRLDEKESK